MQHDEALKIATELHKQINPNCYKCAVAGSLRRRKEDVKDIEIIAIPKPFYRTHSLIGPQSSDLLKVLAKLELVKGKMVYGKTRYTQWIVPEGFIEGSEAIKLDLFFTTEQSWGRTLAMRTGPGLYSKNVLSVAYLKAGYTSKDNILYDKNGNAVSVPEEKDFFKLIGIPYVQPWDRRYTW